MKQQITQTALFLSVGMLAIFWLVAGEAIRRAAPIVVYSLAGLTVLAGVMSVAWFGIWQYYRLKAHITERNRDATLAENEANRDTLHLDFERMALAAQARQMAAGALYASRLGEASFASHTKAGMAALGEGEKAEPIPHAWPEMVRLFDLLPGRRGDVNNIVLGVNLDQATGKQSIIKVPLEDMIHDAVGGETGTGKSTLVYAMAYQLVTAPQDVKLVLADPAGTTWKTLANCEQLMYPVVQENNDLIHVLNELLRETEHRTNELFASHPTVEKLSDYNALVGRGDQLGYIVAMIDEFPEYMEDREVETLVKRLIRKSRKAGIYLFALGTSWKATDLDTSIKRQFRTKVHFAASDPQSSNVLLGSRVAADITAPGRAFARLPFGASADLVEIQCAYLDKHEAMDSLAQRSILDLPEAGPALAEKAVIDARSRGESWSETYRIYHKLTRDSDPPARPSAAQIGVVKEISAKWNAK